MEQSKDHPVWADYTIYPDGRVFSKKRGHFKKYQKTKSGYCVIAVYKDKAKNYKSIHRLVAEAFIPNPNPDVLTDVNHIDNNKENNCVENLEWCTHAENLQHSNILESSKTRALSLEQVDEIRELIAQGIGQTSIANKFNVSRCTIYHIKNNLTWELSV